jgi:hypothetical protein
LREVLGGWHNRAMPLDVQPLSPRRQGIRILVMAGLLAVSLGLAQALVSGRAPPGRWHAEFPVPPGVEHMPVNGTPEAQVEAMAVWPQGERHFMAFWWEDQLGLDPRQYMQVLMDQALAVTPVRAMNIRTAVFAGHRGLEAERRVGKEESAVFAIIRLARIEGHIGAFCLRGEGGMTDADKEFFDDYCQRQIQVHLERAR